MNTKTKALIALLVLALCFVPAMPVLACTSCVAGACAAGTIHCCHITAVLVGVAIAAAIVALVKIRRKNCG